MHTQVKIALQECEDVSEQINKELKGIQSALRENTGKSLHQVKFLEKCSISFLLQLLQYLLACLSYSVLTAVENRDTSEQVCSFKTSKTNAQDTFEDDLHRELAVTKRKLEQYEVLEFEAQEKRIIVEEEIAEESKEWKELRKLLHTVIKSQCKQVQLYKVRAKDATVSVVVSTSCILYTHCSELINIL